MHLTLCEVRIVVELRFERCLCYFANILQDEGGWGVRLTLRCGACPVHLTQDALLAFNSLILVAIKGYFFCLALLCINSASGIESDVEERRSHALLVHLGLRAWRDGRRNQEALM